LQEQTIMATDMASTGDKGEISNSATQCKRNLYFQFILI
jgi:hypothetical protein